MYISSPCFSSFLYSAWEEFILYLGKVIVLSWPNETHYPFPKSFPYFVLGLKILKIEPSAWKQGMEKGRKSSWRKKIKIYRLGFLKMLCCCTAHDLLHFSYFLAEIFYVKCDMHLDLNMHAASLTLAFPYLQPRQNNYFIILYNALWKSPSPMLMLSLSYSKYIYITRMKSKAIIS